MVSFRPNSRGGCESISDITMGESYTLTTYRTVVATHGFVFVICFVLTAVAVVHTQNRQVIHEDGVEQQDIPYWVAGIALGGANVLLFLLSWRVFSLGTKGIYTEQRQKRTRDADGFYRFLLTPTTLFGFAGAILTGNTGFCENEADKRCFYVSTNFAVNKALASTLIAIHCIWFLVGMHLLKQTKTVRDEIKAIPVGSDLEAYHRGRFVPRACITITAQLQSPSCNGPSTLTASTRVTAPTRNIATTIATGALPTTPPGAPPPSYDSVVNNLCTVHEYTQPPAYDSVKHLQPTNPFTGNAFPEGTPVVAHVQ